MEAPVISVIIPTYKPGNYIYECLDSLGAQTLQQSAFETIIVVNGERHPYFSMLTDYAAEHPDRRLRVVYSEGKGVSRARNVGLDEARGRYIAFFDDDDWASPNYLENLFAETSEGTLVVTNVKLIDEATGQQLTYYTTDAFDALERREQFTMFQARSFISSAWGKLIPRELIADDRFPAGYALGEDALFMFIISKRIRKIKLAPRDTVYYIRYRLCSVSHRQRSYWERVRVAIKVSAKYTSVYLSQPQDYSFTLYLSRVAATLRKLLQRGYEPPPSPILGDR